MMIKIYSNEEKVMLGSDLKEGDIALLGDSDYTFIAYVFRQSSLDKLSMVSLSSTRGFWSNSANCNLKVIKVFKPGEKLEIA